MKLNSYIISKWLKGITGRKLVSDPLEAALTGAAPYRQEAAWDPSILYIAEQKDLPDEPPAVTGGLLLVIGMIPENYGKAPFDMLSFGSYMSVDLLMEEVLRIFSRYAQWEDELLNALIQHRDLNELCRISLSIFRNPMMIHGVDFELLGYADSDGYKYTYEFREKGTDFVNQEVVNMLITDSQYPVTFTYRTPHFYNDKWDVLDIYMNVFINNTYVARVVIDSIYEPLAEYDFYPLIRFVGFVQRHMELYPTSAFKYLHSFKEHLVDFLNTPEQGEPFVLNHTLERINWKRESTYLCAYMEPDRRALSSNSIEFQCGLLENTFHNCIAVVISGHIFCVFNCGILNSDLENVKAGLAVFVRDQLMHAGVSTVFHDFLQLPAFFRQAKAAFSCGEERQDNAWIHAFSEIRLEYILKNGIFSLPAEALIPAELQDLLLYDRSHNNHLYETLKVYLEENCNIQKTIDLLFIHRSTFNYRLSRIYSFFPEKMIDTPEKRLYILAVFHLIRTEDPPAVP